MIACLLIAEPEHEIGALAGVFFHEAARFQIERRSDAIISYLDLGTISRHQDSVERGRQLGQSVRAEIEVAPAIGMASGKFPAYVMAAIITPGRLQVIPTGTEAAALAPLPVALLPLDREMARRLRLLGIRTLGQFAALPAGAVLSQFGPAGRRLHRWAGGQDDRPVEGYQPEQIEREHHQFVDPVTQQAVLDTVLRQMVGVVTARLREQSRMTKALHLCVTLEDETQVRRNRAYIDALGDESQLARDLCRLLDAVRIDCGVVAVDVTFSRLVAATGEQLTLFAPETGHADALQDTLPDLVERYGHDRFCRLQRAESDAAILERRIRNTVRTV